MDAVRLDRGRFLAPPAVCTDGARLMREWYVQSGGQWLQQVVSVEYELIEDDLKTASSRRTIDLDEQTIAMLRRHRRGQLEERMATGQRDEDGFVFARPDGSPVHPDLISQTFQRFMDGEFHRSVHVSAMMAVDNTFA